MAQDFLTIIATIIAALSGTIVGFLLNRYQNREDNENQKKSARMLISLEIDKNLEMLKELWLDVNNLDPEKDLVVNEDDEDYEGHKINLAYKLADLNMPHWTNESWKSQLPYVPLALNKNEIKSINDFYSDLYTINAIYSSMLSVISNDMENSRTHQLLPPERSWIAIPFVAFYQSAPSLWDKFEKITLKLIEKGNPLNSII